MKISSVVQKFSLGLFIFMLLFSTIVYPSDGMDVLDTSTEMDVLGTGTDMDVLDNSTDTDVPDTNTGMDVLDTSTDMDILDTSTKMDVLGDGLNTDPDTSAVITLTLNSKNAGFSFQRMCAVGISDSSADFYILNGKITGANGAKISGSALSGFDENKLFASLSPEFLKTSMTGDKNTFYTIVSPNGYLGMVVLTDMDVSNSSYSGVVGSIRTDQLVKTQIVSENSSSNSNNGMDTLIGSGDMDYFDTELYTELTNVFFEGTKKQLKIAPRIYSNGEILISLRDIAPMFNLKVQYGTYNGVEKARIESSSAAAELQAYSDTALVNNNKIKLNRTCKMDKNGIMIPLSFLSKYYGVHFVANESTKTLLSGRKPIIEWRYGGYNNKAPYIEYEIKFVDGVKTAEKRLNGKKHIFKNVTIYNKKTGKPMTVKENQVSSFSKDWSTTPPSSHPSSGSKTTTDALNAYWTRYNLHRFLNSSTFDTWGGNMLRRITP